MASTRRWRPGTGLVMVLTAWLLATPQVEAQPFAANELAIVHINVGQGDAPLILGPADANGDRIAVLMDAGDINGPDGGILVGAVLAQYGVTRLDVFIASHYDADHIGGILAISEFPNERTALIGVCHSSSGGSHSVRNWLGTCAGISRSPTVK